MALMWGNINICPSLQQFQIPSFSSTELSSLNSLRVLGEGQKVCNNIVFLLVLAEEEATGDRKYSLSTVWVNPCQARVPFMLHEGTHHVPLPKEGHLGILPQRGAEATPCRWISQMEVCKSSYLAYKSPTQ